MKHIKPHSQGSLITNTLKRTSLTSRIVFISLRSIAILYSQLDKNLLKRSLSYRLSAGNLKTLVTSPVLHKCPATEIFYFSVYVSKYQPCFEDL